MSRCRERQDADGQMKELQDQLEAEQYFSVSLCGLLSSHRFTEAKRSVCTEDASDVRSLCFADAVQDPGP